jgi:iron complex transport system ATP-binding protein
METSALRVQDIEIRIGGVTILGPVSLTVGRGEHWALLGPNGSGKTTLLSVAGAWRHPSAGRAWVLGERLGRTDVRTLRARIGHIGHHVNEAVRGQMTALDVVLTGRGSTLVTWFCEFGPADIAEAEARLTHVGCSPLRDRSLVTCSQGERQRVCWRERCSGTPSCCCSTNRRRGWIFPVAKRCSRR